MENNTQALGSELKPRLLISHQFRNKFFQFGHFCFDGRDSSIMSYKILFLELMNN